MITISIPKEELSDLSLEELSLKYNCTIETILKHRAKFLDNPPCCPYCSKTFGSWRGVNLHVADCKLSTNDVYIDTAIGPIRASVISNMKNTKDLQYYYPGAKASWTNLKASFKNLDIKWPPFEWSKELVTERLSHFIDRYKRAPKASDLDNVLFYPSSATVRRLFGTLTLGIRTVIPDYEVQRESNIFGVPTKANDGHIYRSKFEAKFVNTCLFNKVKYIYEIPYSNGIYLYDFYVPEKELYIELAGLIDKDFYKLKIQEKIEINKQENKKFLLIYPKDRLENIDIRKL